MIYVHVPFCRSFCTYCDFYSEVAGCRSEQAFARYVDDLCAEAEARRDEIAASAGIQTLYIGGGTPSVLSLDCLQRIEECLKAAEGSLHSGRDDNWQEFTIEVNPEDIVERGPEYVEGLLKLGVTRISMGVQSLDDGILRWMNRRHSADGARQAWRIISGAVQGNSRLDRSVDIITGVPGMSMEMLQTTVEEILTWRPEHLSAYQLSVEDGSALAKMIADGRAAEASEEDCRAQYDWLCSRLREAGYHHYEISNWALPGHEAVHNSAYWTRQPYVGLGPGAHSLTYLDETGCPVRPGMTIETTGATQRRSWNSQKPSGWTEEGSETLTPEEIHEEAVMLLARTDRGPIPERDWFIADELIPGLL